MYMAAACAVAIMITLASCSNAVAQNDKKATKVTEITTNDFNSIVYDLSKEGLTYLGTKAAVIDFYAPWCGPCQRIAPIMEKLAEEYDGEIVFYKMDVGKNREVARVLNVTSIPAVLYIPVEGEPVMTIGARTKGRFSEEIDTILLGK
jgi:thioredoxin